MRPHFLSIQGLLLGGIARLHPRSSPIVNFGILRFLVFSFLTDRSHSVLETAALTIRGTLKGHYQKIKLANYAVALYILGPPHMQPSRTILTAHALQAEAVNEIGSCTGPNPRKC